jgi:UDP-glucose 4-epimerase
VIDNCHNAFPEAVNRCNEIATKELGYVHIPTRHFARTLIVSARDKAPKAIFHKVDLRDPASIEEVFAKYDNEGGIWAAVHLAALKAVGESGEIPLEYYKVNVGGSITLMEVSNISTMSEPGIRADFWGSDNGSS